MDTRVAGILTNREELLLRTVFALPYASKTGLAWIIWSSREPTYVGRRYTQGKTEVHQHGGERVRCGCYYRGSGWCRSPGAADTVWRYLFELYL